MPREKKKKKKKKGKFAAQFLKLKRMKMEKPLNDILHTSIHIEHIINIRAANSPESI